MKKFIMVSAVLALLMSCGGGDSNKSKEEKKDETADITKNPDYQKGLDVLAKSNCGTCHKVDERVPGQGPSFREVANKYGSYPDTIVTHLAKKVIKGGSGVWGEVPMIPHPELSEEEAGAIVKYVLLLKN
jgi:cytochrome c